MLCALWRKTSACVHFSNFFFFLWNLSFTVQWTFDGKESLCVLSVRTLRCHSKTYCGLTFCFQTIRYRKPRIWAMKEEKYTMKSRQKSGLCDITYERYSGKRFNQMYKASSEDAILVSLWEAHVAAENQQKHLSSRREFITWVKKCLFWDKECLDSKISKTPGNVCNPDKSFLYQKTNTPFEPKICLNKDF